MTRIARLLLFYLFLIPVLMVAQNNRVYVMEGIGTTMIETSKNYNSTILYDSFWDFDSDFKYGILYLINGDSIDNLGIRYNITRDRFEVVSNVNKGIYIVNPDAIRQIKRMSEKFTYSKFYDAGNKLSKGYFKIVYDGKTKLLYRKLEKHKEGKEGAFGYSAYKSFETNYYIKKSDEEFPAIFKKTEESVLHHLSDKKEAIEVLVASKHLNYRKIADLISILTFYDSL